MRGTSHSTFLWQLSMAARLHPCSTWRSIGCRSLTAFELVLSIRTFTPHRHGASLLPWEPFDSLYKFPFICFPLLPHNPTVFAVARIPHTPSTTQKKAEARRAKGGEGLRRDRMGGEGLRIELMGGQNNMLRNRL